MDGAAIAGMAVVAVLLALFGLGIAARHVARKAGCFEAFGPDEFGAEEGGRDGA